MESRIEKIAQKASKVVGIIGCIILLWLLISWMEVVSNNLTPGYDYWDWNFFCKVVQWFPSN